MRRIALAVLVHDRLRTSLSMAGIAAVMALVLLQWGLLAGFSKAASELVHRFDRGAWLVARGTRALEEAEPLSAAALSALAAEPCVGPRDPIVLDYHQLRHPDWHLETILLVARDEALAIPARIDGAVRLGDHDVATDDELDLGSELSFRGGARATIRARTHGLRSAGQIPYVFTTTILARSLLGLPEGAAHFVTFSADGACLDSLRARPAFEHAELLATGTLAARVEHHWIHESGLGHVLGFGLSLALAVAAVVFGQTLLAHVRTHRAELAALRAAGATKLQLASFVFWQAGVVTALGIVLGAAAGALLAPHAMLPIRIDPATLARATGVIVLAALVACMLALRLVLSIQPHEVLR